MSSHHPDEAPFSWPPEPADMDRIDVLDVTDAASVPAALTSGSTVFRRLRRRRQHNRSRPRVKTTARAAAREAWLLLASGVLIGATLPGIVRTHSSALSAQQTGTSATNAPPLVRTSTEGAALRSMQAMLRGDRATPAAPGSVAPVLLQTRIGPAGATRPPLQPPALPPVARASVNAAVSLAPVASPPVASVDVPPAGAPSARVTLTDVATPSRRLSRRPPATAVAARANASTRDVAVRRVLQAYERAWTRMDTEAARALWPSADATTLQAEFRPVSEQRLQLAACDVGVSGDRALAICLGTLRYRPRDGGSMPRVERGRWEFELERSPAGWQISTVDRP